MEQAVVLVLASGRGERFTASGGRGWKLDALLAGKPVLQHTLDAVAASGLPCHVERGPHAGMGNSLAAAVRATPDAPAWLVLPADLPLVRPETLQAVARALRDHDVVVPCHQGHRGHPVGFSARHRVALGTLHGPRGAAAIVAAGHPLLLELDDPGILADIDTVDDLTQAERLLSARSG